jgi:glucokinase
MRLAGAIDIGGSAIKIGIVASDGTVITRERVPMTMQGEPIPVIDSIAAAIRPMLDAMTAEKRPVAGIGVSVAGFLNPARSAMIHNANLPALREFELRDALEERLSLDCRLEVDSNAAVLAEYRHGAGQGSARLLGVTVGTGLGGGVIIDGELLRYTGECAGDIGHIIVDRKGRVCSCGARGCLEAMVNVAALSERGNGRTVREIIAAARKGDEPSKKALTETGFWLGLGLASLSPLFSPDRIVVGGGIAAAGELLLEPTLCSYREHVRPEFRNATRVVGSTFEGWDGMIGAASLFLDPLA